MRLCLVIAISQLVRSSTGFTPKNSALTGSLAAISSCPGRSLQATESTSKDMLEPVIIGSGISSLATAVALQNMLPRDRLSSITILERCSEKDLQDDTKGAGAQLGPNGLRALRAIAGESLMNKCIDQASKIEGTAIVMPKGADPMLIPDHTKGEFGLPQIFIRWGVLRKLLLDELDKDTVKIITDSDSNICGYKTDNDGTVSLIMSSEHNLDAKGNLLISAEGIRSTCRLLINNDTRCIPTKEEMEAATAKDIKDAGRVNIKAIVPIEMDGAKYQKGYQYCWFAPDGGIGCFCGPAGEGSSYWAISIADSVDEENGEATRFVSDLEDLVDVKNALLDKLQSLDTKDCKLVMDLVEQTTSERICVSRSEESTKVGPRLHNKDGNIVLVGDSAHGMSASYGQNPALALEDGAVLASCIKSSYKVNDDVKVALESYSEQRVSRCLEIQKRAADRAAKAMKGEQTEDISKWIFQWDLA